MNTSTPPIIDQGFYQQYRSGSSIKGKCNVLEGNQRTVNVLVEGKELRPKRVRKIRFQDYDTAYVNAILSECPMGVSQAIVVEDVDLFYHDHLSEHEAGDANGVLYVELWCTKGNLTLATKAQLTFDRPESDRKMTFYGSLNAINAVLRTLVYTAQPNAFGHDTIFITVSDSSVRSRNRITSGIVQKQLDVVISPLNQAPEIHISKALLKSSQDLTLSLANTIQFSDVDAGDAAIVVFDVEVRYGILAISPQYRHSVAYLEGDGVSDQRIEILATIAQANDVMHHLTYLCSIERGCVPGRNDTIRIHINDQGHSSGATNDQPKEAVAEIQVLVQN